jgi:peptidoglycan/LPS O-acetylase OafA/YrhL
MPDRHSASFSYRPDLDGLRGFAILLVVVYHAFPTLRTGGFVGVDVFFVISGYLITQIIIGGLRAKRFKLAEFYRRRVRRILPALLVVMSTCCIGAWLLFLPGELQWFSRSLSWCALFLANIFFATTGGYFVRSAELSPLLHLWSLGVEEQFYLVWPLLLVLGERFGITKRLLAAIIGVSLAISVWGGWYAPTHYFYYPDSRAWELAVGGLLAAWQLDALGKRVVGPPSPRRSIIGLALIIAAGFLWNIDKPIPGSWCLLPVCGAALLISAGENAPVNRHFLASRAMLFLGKISYPLYLWHWPLFSFTRNILGHAPQAALAAIECAIAIAAAYATYRWVEAPIRFGKNVRAAVPALLAGVACLAVIGGVLNARWIAGRLRGPTFVAWDEAVRDWYFPGETNFAKHSGFTTAKLPSRGPGKIVFIGDSHLQQYWPRVAWLIDNHADSARSAEFVTQAGCPMLPNLNVRGRGHNCNELFDFAQVRALQPDVDTVVFGSFWEDYFMGEFSNAKTRPRVYSMTERSPESLAIDSPGTRIAFEQFEAVVKKLVSSGRRVFIVLSNPTSQLFVPLFPPRLRFTVHSFESVALDSGATLDARSFEAYVAPLMNTLREIAAHTGAQVVEPSSTLCRGFICPAADADGLPQYIDSNHLRGTAAREHATFIDEMVLARYPAASSALFKQQEHEPVFTR